jgi:hypothetical protein
LINIILHSNTELEKDIAQQVIGSDFAGDLPEVVQGLEDVHGKLVTADFIFQVFSTSSIDSLQNPVL